MKITYRNARVIATICLKSLLRKELFPEKWHRIVEAKGYRDGIACIQRINANIYGEQLVAHTMALYRLTELHLTKAGLDSLNSEIEIFL